MKKDEAIATLIRHRIGQAEKTIEDAHCLLSGNGSPKASSTGLITPCSMQPLL